MKLKKNFIESLSNCNLDNSFPESFIIGDKVWLNGIYPGRIQYIGEVHFGHGDDWAGLVLDEPIGKHDGSVNGQRYYYCENKKGLFTKLSKLTRVPLRAQESPDSGAINLPSASLKPRIVLVSGFLYFKPEAPGNWLVTVLKEIELSSSQGVTKNVTAVGFNTDGRWMYSGSEDGFCRIWDLKAPGHQCQQICSAKSSVNTTVLHPNQYEIYFGDQNGYVYVWDLRANKSQSMLVDNDIAINHLSVEPDDTPSPKKSPVILVLLVKKAIVVNVYTILITLMRQDIYVNAQQMDTSQNQVEFLDCLRNQSLLKKFSNNKNNSNQEDKSSEENSKELENNSEKIEDLANKSENNSENVDNKSKEIEDEVLEKIKKKVSFEEENSEEDDSEEEDYSENDENQSNNSDENLTDSETDSNYESDDEGDWITPKNINLVKKQFETLKLNETAIEEKINTACITGDFSMQNVLMQIGSLLIGPCTEPIYNTDGKRLNTREFRVRKKLEDERHQLVQNMTTLNPHYKAPLDYK
ncbi:hypothetical protein RND71_043683 [Anisodus tanguticus]|uniref:Target of rapamycin complex subunit LST8 n=1 Tax=Anisodus tanguticus TaxID=243964 RepID=A0AAE1QQY5_9SOLA|nr:hypothetical protein RND71_043683 [Anisodus tanguticus]